MITKEFLESEINGLKEHSKSLINEIEQTNVLLIKCEAAITAYQELLSKLDNSDIIDSKKE